MKYGFFDYKHFIKGYHGQDFFSATHIAAMAVLTALIVVLLIVFRRAKHSSVDRYLKILSVIVPVIEVIKIVWESYYDLSLGYGFNMLYYYGNGAPVLPKLASLLAGHHLRLVYTFIVLLGYLLIAAVFVCLYKLIETVMRAIKARRENTAA